MLSSIVVLLSPLSGEEFASLAREESYAWKRVEEIMNDYRNKLGSNSILEYKVRVLIFKYRNRALYKFRLWFGRRS